MTDGITLFTINGPVARLLKALIGTPLLGVGALLIYYGLGDMVMENLLLLIFGVVFVIGGVAAYASAVTNDELRVTVGGSSSSSFE